MKGKFAAAAFPFYLFLTLYFTVFSIIFPTFAKLIIIL